jgi:hypothetical protein
VCSSSRKRGAQTARRARSKPIRNEEASMFIARLALIIIALIGAFAVALAAGCSGVDPNAPPSEQQCTNLRAHVVDLQLGIAPDAVLAELPRSTQRHRANLMTAARDRYLDTCQSTYSRDFVRCAAAARTLDDYHACETE